MIGATKENEALKAACEGALAAIEKINSEEFSSLQEKLTFVIGSYEFDKNPVGLIEFAIQAKEQLAAYKESNPRKVAKTVLEKLEKSLAKLEATA